MKRRPLHYFRLTLLVVLAIGVGLYIAAYNFLQSDLARQLLKSRIEQELGKAFKRRVTIQELSGNLVSRVVLINVRFENQPHFQGQPIFTVKKIEANYSLPNAVRTGGDFMAAASSIVLTDIDAQIVRAKDGRINLFEFIPPPPPGVILPPPTFRGRLVFQNMHGTFYDESGWSQGEVRSFSESFDHINGDWNFQQITKTRLAIGGRMMHANRPFRVDGKMNTINGQFDFRVNLPQMQMSYWGSYLMTIPDYHLTGGIADVRGHLVSKSQGDPPFNYNLNIQLNNATLKLPFFPVESTGLSGKLLIKNSGLTLNRFNGQINQIPYSGSGSIGFVKNNIDLGIRLRPFDYTKLAAVFPVLAPFQVTGTANATIAIKGKTSSPHVQGSYSIANGTVYGLNLEHASGALDLLDRQLLLTVTRSVLANGSVTADAKFNFSSSPAMISAVLSGHHILGEKIGDAYGFEFGGDTDLFATVSGPTTGVLIHGELQNSNLMLANQQLSSAAIDAKFWPGERFQVDRLVVGVNHGPTPIYGSGSAGSDMVLNLNVAGENIPLNDIMKPNSTLQGNLNVSGNVKVAMGATVPKGGQVQAHLSGTVSHAPVMGEVIQNIRFDGDYSNSKTVLNQFEFNNGNEQVSLQGTLNGYSPLDLNVVFNQISLGHPLIQAYLPRQILPVSGTVSGRGHWFNSGIEGDLAFENLNIQNQPVARLNLTGSWRDHTASISNFNLTEGESAINLSGWLKDSGDLSIGLLSGTHVVLRDFDAFLNRFGVLKGTLDLSGQVSGNISALNCNLGFSGSQLLYNTVPFPKISGQLLLTPTRFGLSNTALDVGKGKVRLTGSMARSVAKGASVFDSDYNLDANFENTDLSQVAQLMALIRREVKAKNEGEQSNVRVGDDPALGYGIEDPLANLKTVPIYSGQSDVQRMQLFHQIEDRQRVLTQPVVSDFSQDIHGILNGNLKLSSTPQKFPKVSADLNVSDAKLLFLNANLIRLNIRPMASRLSAGLRLEQGDFGGGAFDRFEVMGDLDSQGDFIIDSATVGLPQGTYSGLVTGVVPLAPFYMAQSQDRKMDVSVHLQNDSLSVLSLFSPYVKSISGEGSADLSISGPLSAPVARGVVGPIQNLKLTLSPENTPFQSPFLFPKFVAPIENNQIRLSNIPIEWKGQDTQQFRTGQDITNRFQLNGTIGIPKLSLLRPDWMVFDMNLAVSDTDLSLNFPDFYTGSATVRNMTIKGPFRIPFSADAKTTVAADLSTAREIGPVVSGKVSIFDGNVTAPKFSQKKPKPSFLFDVTADIGKEVSLSGGLFEGGLGALAGSVNLDFAENQQDIHIKGSTNSPMVAEAIGFSSGDFQFFSRNFEILTPQQQQQFSKAGAFQQSPNTVRLDTEVDPKTAKRSFVPQFNMAAATIIEPLISVTPTDNTTGGLAGQDTNYRAVLAHISGPAYSLQAWQFTEYNVEDPDKQYRFADNRLDNWRITSVASYEFSNTRGSSSSDSDSGIQHLIQVLMPGYYKDVIDDFAKDNFQSDKTKKLISFYGERQINSVFHQSIRPSERALAQQLGLVDVRVNYDLGNTLLKSASDITGYQGLGRTEQNLGVDFVSRFFVDQMFLRVQTNLDLTGEHSSGLGDNVRVSELELSYFPFKNSLSLNVANVRKANDEFRPRYSLRYSYEF